MLYHRLRQLDQRGTPIQIGLIAAGTFGTQIASQLGHAPGMRLAAIAELDLTKARSAYGRGDVSDDQIDTADDPAAIDAAMDAGRYAVTVDARALMESRIDLVIEATGNVEAGATFRKANPDDVPRLYGFTGRDYNAQMFGSFLDGTKHAIEMACLANMSGLVPDVRGMHFPAVDLRDIPDILCHRSKGGLLNAEGVVEAVSLIDENERAVERGLRGGLYCVVDGATPFAMESLGSYGEIIGMIIGQRSGYGMIYRPQHWIGHEMPISAARIALDGQTSGHPIGHYAEVVTAAKKPLAAGTVLDGEGGYCAYGLLEKAALARSGNLLPIGLSQRAVLTRDIPEDALITYDDVELPDSELLALRRQQEADLCA